MKIESQFNEHHFAQQSNNVVSFKTVMMNESARHSKEMTNKNTLTDAGFAHQIISKMVQREIINTMEKAREQLKSEDN